MGIRRTMPVWRVAGTSVTLHRQRVGYSLMTFDRGERAAFDAAGFDYAIDVPDLAEGRGLVATVLGVEPRLRLAHAYYVLDDEGIEIARSSPTEWRLRPTPPPRGEVVDPRWAALLQRGRYPTRRAAIAAAREIARAYGDAPRSIADPRVPFRPAPRPFPRV